VKIYWRFNSLFKDQYFKKLNDSTQDSLYSVLMASLSKLKLNIKRWFFSPSEKVNFVSKKIFQKFLPDLNLLIAMFTNTSSITFIFLQKNCQSTCFFCTAFFRFFFSSNIYFLVDLTGIHFGLTLMLLSATLICFNILWSNLFLTLRFGKNMFFSETIYQIYSLFCWLLIYYTHSNQPFKWIWLKLQF
jgi:hypothetical protein